MTAYTGAFLDKLNVRDFHDLSQFTPGFYVQNQSPNNSGFVMRGITTDSATPPTSRASPSSRTGVDITDKLQVSGRVRNSYEHKTTSYEARNLSGPSVLGALLHVQADPTDPTDGALELDALARRTCPTSARPPTTATPCAKACPMTA